MSVHDDIAKVRDATNRLLAEGRASSATAQPLDPTEIALTTADALLHVLAALEGLERRVALAEHERR